MAYDRNRIDRQNAYYRSLNSTQTRQTSTIEDYYTRKEEAMGRQNSYRSSNRREDRVHASQRSRSRYRNEQVRQRKATHTRRVRRRKTPPDSQVKRILTKYPKIHINTGIVILGFIFLYMLVCIFASLTSSHISAYEVRTGNLVVDNSCTGLILRNEDIVYAEGAGYINYYIPSGDKVSGSSNVYTLDANGSNISSLTEEYLSAGILDSASLASLKNSIEAYETDISDMDFYAVSDFKTRISNSMVSLVNEKLFSDAANLDSKDSSGMFNFVKAAKPGIIEYYTDGYEDVRVDEFKEEMLDQSTYEYKDLTLNEIVASGDPVYKLITGEDWKIIIPLDEEKSQALANRSTITIRFTKNSLETTANVDIMRKDEKTYAVLSLVNYMVDFAQDRYITIELVLSSVDGLKIPSSAITEKQFYTVPLGFETEGGDDANSIGYLKEVYKEDGSISTVFVPTTIYASTDQVNYVDCGDFSTGDYLVKPDSQERYQIGSTASLRGVYNIDRGYTIFRQINILYESDEYCIVEQGDKYGLVAYDHIVLDAKSVKENEIIVK